MKKKIIMIAIIITILGIAAYFIVKKVRQNKAGRTGTGTDTASIFPLKQGSRGAQVKNVQSALNKLLALETKLIEDGIFGPKTEDVLYRKVGLKQLTKNQYEALVATFADIVMAIDLYDDEKKKIQNA
jgi:hypothetical protein